MISLLVSPVLQEQLGEIFNNRHESTRTVGSTFLFATEIRFLASASEVYFIQCLLHTFRHTHMFKPTQPGVSAASFIY